ncbi:hypothetical protein EXIGLDRAFT_719825 [Exidia glandulosa HHB12029]|uniref:F-box domain-containing protein n=1 Tax=Exidia glandulosa HHB12029 TaxID=1314781 RepID=A0A165GTH5_EXIGL|nr:hypothetical protein EXIGLDRAFT_719825 [Exidia glandulosa HHB12029]
MTRPSDMLSLPPELIREIIELVASDAISQDLAWVATSLVLVSRDIRAWVHPILYHTIHIDEDNNIALLRLLVSKPSEFFAPLRHVILVECFGRGRPPTCIARLPPVQTCTVDYLGFLALQSHYIATIRATRIIMAFGAVPSLFDPRPFAAVTHLRLLLEEDVDWSPKFSLMPVLSHIIFDVLFRISSNAVLEANVRAALVVPSCQRVVVQAVTDIVRSYAEGRFGNLVKALRLLGDSRVYVARLDEEEWVLSFTGDARTCGSEARKGPDPWSIGDRVM